MNRRTSHRVAFAVRFALALAVVATTMAVACPQPESQEPLPVDPGTETKSDARVAFESRTVTGLYFNDGGTITYSEESFQQAVNHNRKNFRIQSDDQERYFNLNFTDRIPQKTGDEAVAKITYRNGTDGETVVIVKFKAVIVKNEKLWLWNELQQLGAIIPAF
ncbi:MAG: hypothetical protein J5699_04875 [Bacteroidales bacterium]|nr:hypothetical protein [Bacteroidales bacterium]